MRRHQEAFARKIPRSQRARAGRTRVSETPLDIRVSGVRLPEGFRADARALLGRRLGRFATHIERATVRFEDVNGPRGGIDTVCRIQLTVSGRPPVLVQCSAVDAEAALKRSATAATRAMGRSVGKVGLRTRPPTRPAPSRAPARRSPRRPTRWPEGGSLVGRRVGRSRRNVVRAASRPEKKNRAFFIDTAAPGVSETDRKAGGGSSAARNTKLRLARMGYTLEDSARKPSRKSTRKSASRAKSGSKLARRQKRRLRSPKARATRARVRQQRGTAGRG